MNGILLASVSICNTNYTHLIQTQVEKSNETIPFLPHSYYSFVSEEYNSLYITIYIAIYYIIIITSDCKSDSYAVVV